MIVLKNKRFFFVIDKRAKHVCTWPGHRTHVDEVDVFYTELNSAICGYRRLVSIPNIEIMILFNLMILCKLTADHICKNL